MKIKIGESWGTDTRRDLARVALARRVVGDDVELYVDANGGYTRKQAVRMGRAFHEDDGVTWFEEPVSSDDLAGLREVRDNCGADVAAGEYGYSLDYFARMVDADAIDCLQADVTRCGGYTVWLQAASVAAAHNLQISGHCAPNLHAHVATAVAEPPPSGVLPRPPPHRDDTLRWDPPTRTAANSSRRLTGTDTA